MPSITNSQDATLLQLQYVAESCGLRRSYLPHELSGETFDDSERNEKGSLTTSVSHRPTKAAAGPNIEWHPSYQTYLDRVKRLSGLAVDRPRVLPDGFPDALDSPRVWSGSDFDDVGKYLICLTHDDIAEIEAALSHFSGLNISIRVFQDRTYYFHLALPGDNGPDQVSQETFPLPKLSHKLSRVAMTLHYGIGFAVLRGLDPKKYSPLDNVILYLGITSYVAELRGVQDYDGRMIGRYRTCQHVTRHQSLSGFCSAH